jgi:iron complex transport system ATP-binding protein
MSLKIDNYSNQILKNISFTLSQNQNLIILGSNGIGKTTLAKVICGITPSDNVSINGINPSKIFGIKRAKEINYIPPKLEIFDEFITLRTFLELGYLNYSLNIDKVLEIVEITHLQNQPCKRLSSGESQLLLIASSLLHSANFTIFDEPTANLDPQKIKLLFNIFRDEALLKSKIIITHNLDLAYKLGFDILFLADKTISFYGSSSKFFSDNNLNKVYQGSIQKVSNSIVTKLSI